MRIELNESVVKYYILIRLKQELHKYRWAISEFSKVFTRCSLQRDGVDEREINILQRNCRGLKSITYHLEICDSTIALGMYIKIMEDLDIPFYTNFKTLLQINTGNEIDIQLLKTKNLYYSFCRIGTELDNLLKDPTYKGATEKALHDMFLYRGLLFKALFQYPVKVLGLKENPSVRNTDKIHTDKSFLSCIAQKKQTWESLRELDQGLYKEVSKFQCSNSGIDQDIVNIINRIINS